MQAQLFRVVTNFGWGELQIFSRSSFSLLVIGIAVADSPTIRYCQYRLGWPSRAGYLGRGHSNLTTTQIICNSSCFFNLKLAVVTEDVVDVEAVDEVENAP